MAERTKANALDAPMSIYEVHLGSWRRVPEEGNRLADLPRDGPAPGRIRPGDGLHPRRVPADHGAPLLRLVGLPDHRLLRPDQPLRDAAGLHVPRGHAPPVRHRRHPRLGALAFRHRRARPGAASTAPPLRAPGPAQGLPPRLEERHLQLRPQRGPRVPHQQRPLLARPLPRRRPPHRRRGLDALPRLLPQGGGVDPQPLRRPGEPRGPELHPAPQRGRLRRPSPASRRSPRNRRPGPWSPGPSISAAWASA